MFDGEFLSGVFQNTPYATQHYVSEPPSDELIADCEASLGVKLPCSYIELMKFQNGGELRKTKIASPNKTSWGYEYIPLMYIFGIGNIKDFTLCGKRGSNFWVSEWKYPTNGLIYFCDTSSGGHDLLAFDYRECGENGEPCIVHVDQEFGFAITKVAPNFETLMRDLEEDISDD